MDKYEELKNILIEGKVRGLTVDEVLDEFYKGTICKYYCSIETPSQVYEEINKNGSNTTTAIRNFIFSALEADKGKYIPEHEKIIRESVLKSTHGSNILVSRVRQRIRQDSGERIYKSYSVYGTLDIEYSNKLNNLTSITKEQKAKFVGKWVKIGIDYELEMLNKNKTEVIDIEEKLGGGR